MDFRVTVSFHTLGGFWTAYVDMGSDDTSSSTFANCSSRLSMFMHVLAAALSKLWSQRQHKEQSFKGLEFPMDS